MVCRRPEHVPSPCMPTSPSPRSPPLPPGTLSTWCRHPRETQQQAMGKRRRRTILLFGSRSSITWSPFNHLESTKTFSKYVTRSCPLQRSLSTRDKLGIGPCPFYSGASLQGSLSTRDKLGIGPCPFYSGASLQGSLSTRDKLGIGPCPFYSGASLQGTKVSSQSTITMGIGNYNLSFVQSCPLFRVSTDQKLKFVFVLCFGFDVLKLTGIILV